MLDFFAIFSKGGIVLWYIQNTSNAINSSVNALIKTVILQERASNAPFINESFAIRYHMDNEFDLVFVVGYQKILQLSYVDKFLTSLALEFRDKYKDDLTSGNITRNFTDFQQNYNLLLQSAEEESREEKKKGREMRSFKDSTKSQKKVSSLIISSNKTEPEKPNKSTNKNILNNKNDPTTESQKSDIENFPPEDAAPVEGIIRPDQIELNKQKMKSKLSVAGKKKGKASDASSESPTSAPQGKRVKAGRKWAGQCNAKDAAALDYSNTSGSVENGNDSRRDTTTIDLSSTEAAKLRELRGKLKSGDLGDIEVDSEEEEEEEDDDVEEKQIKADTKIVDKNQNKSKSGGGMFGLLRNLVSGVGSAKVLTNEDMEPVLEQLRDRLIAKNVAAEIAQKLCDSVAIKLEGIQIGTFERVASKVRQALEETCTQLLSSKRRLDVLRDVMEAQRQGRPYVIVFCGVNGVGKSTNLAKVAFWLVEKGMRVLIAACDTFRSGAVEQLRTHVKKLHFIHPAEHNNGKTMVDLYEKGYGKDSAAIAMSAINSARDQKFDVVLVDTAGRMQDNEPLMRSLAKLIVINNPDLVLFVGEALVGNEAVDQLVKFNQALADNSSSSNPHTIDGIVLTKFDTIDDKVGAAVSMTYISGQPIVFVGTGQTYADLRQLSAPAVVKALMK